MDYDAARYHWEDLYDSSSSSCLHTYLYVNHSDVWIYNTESRCLDNKIERDQLINMCPHTLRV